MSVGRVEKTGANLGVEFCPGQDAERDDVEPEQQSDAHAERAVDLGVVGEPGDVPAEGHGGDEPHDGGDDGAGKCALPGLAHGASQVVDERGDSYDGGEGDDPADEHGKEQDGRPHRRRDVKGEPTGCELPEDYEKAGQRKGKERKRDKEKSMKAALPEGPAIDREFIGTPDTFHQGGEDAGGSGKADEE